MPTITIKGDPRLVNEMSAEYEWFRSHLKGRFRPSPAFVRSREAAKILQVPHEALKTTHERRTGPPFVECCGAVWYSRADLWQWTQIIRQEREFIE